VGVRQHTREVRVGGGGNRERLGGRGGTGRDGTGGGLLEGMSIDESEEFELVDVLQRPCVPCGHVRFNSAPPAGARTEGETRESRETLEVTRETLEVRLRSTGLPEEVVLVCI
jgi:hypothetical protein